MGENPEFDVFLAHNSDDKDEVRVINHHLKRRGLKPWLDEEQIPGGVSFQQAIQLAVPNVKSALILIGPKGLGKWQKDEDEIIRSKFKDDNRPVIPVLLPGVDQVPENLLFLQQKNWVSFTKINDFEALKKLESAIKGSKSVEDYFDVWLYYDEKDLAKVEEIRKKLKERDINVWFNREQLSPGQPEIQSLQNLIQKQRIYSVAVFMGSEGSAWLRNKPVLTGLMFYLSKLVPNPLAESIPSLKLTPVISVYLENYKPEKDILSDVLDLATVDFRENNPDPINQLYWGITGIKIDDAG